MTLHPTTSRRRIRRGVLSFVSVAALALATAACSTGGSSGASGGANEITTLSLYSADSPAGKWLNAMADEFEKANPGITVTNQFVAQTDLPTTYGKSVVAGNEQDIVMTNLVGDPTTWLKNGATVDVSGYLDQWGLSDVFSDGALKAWTTSDGKLQAFPLEGYNWPMWYNTDLLKQAGFSAPPKTWDELIALSTALRADGVQPFVVGAADYPAPAVLTLVALTLLSEDDVTALFTSGDWGGANGQKVIDGVLQLRDAGVFADDSAGLKYPDQVAAFAAGKAAMLFDGSWGYGNAQATFPQIPVQLGGFPLPQGSPVAKPVSFAGQSTGVWISPNGQKKIDEVGKFVSFLYQPANLAAFVDLGYISPARDGYLTLDESALPPLNVASQKELPSETTVYQPTYNILSPTVTSAFFRASTQAFVAGSTAQQVTQSLEQAWQAQ
ncbi:ABC transporter substrate-binding protein [Microbacterium sp. SORGH_AS_0888]|uniref:ABC transporter substrate-binding protein n=1 Tax=Microbacterium sp. SORGH_AS_0888 TaxID=3041791 RepID=UPI002781975A|nr:ABC transporter substrate-binding protein [Microbacterium sp. SORGH_AS_0888]MDQ1131166.1 multiple sugar transport system substrate-binding protein [Microbacterium sp. SORGH_AS_0888]